MAFRSWKGLAAGAGFLVAVAAVFLIAFPVEERSGACWVPCALFLIFAFSFAARAIVVYRREKNDTGRGPG